MKNKIIHKRSSTIIEGKAKLPTVEQLEYGELAINYANDVETIAFKNDKNEIVEIRSNKYFEKVIKDNELVTSSALNNLNQRIQDVSTKVFIGTEEEYNTAYAEGKIAMGALVIILDGSETEEGGATISALLGTAILGQMLLGQK
jgi:hypothetical protein